MRQQASQQDYSFAYKGDGVGTLWQPQLLVF